jgi:hypothetical protein
MRNRDFVSYGFLALIAAGLVLLCSILLGTYLKRSPTEGGLTLQFRVASASTSPTSPHWSAGRQKKRPHPGGELGPFRMVPGERDRHNSDVGSRAADTH